jgi:hypothetical protein
MRRSVATAAGALALASMLLLAACPSLSDIGVGSGMDASADLRLIIALDAGFDSHRDDATHDATAKDATHRDMGVSCDADLQVDPHSCGRCGHDCLGGGCAGGMCEAVVLYAGRDTPSSIVVEDASVLVTVQTANAETGYLFRCATDDCEATKTVMATGLVNPWFALGEGPRVYWVNSGNSDAGAVTQSGTVLSCPADGCPDGGPIGYLPDGGGVEGGATISGVAVDSTYIYWADLFGDTVTSTGGIYKCAIAECPGTLGPLVGGADFIPLTVVVDPSFVYWTDLGTDQVLRCALPSCGGSPQIFANNQTEPSGLAVYGGHVYWSVGRMPTGDGGGVLDCAATGCGTSPTIVAAGQDNPIFVAADDSGVYWTNANSGTVMRCPLAGCTEPVQIARTPAAFWITLDAVSVYFTDSSAFGSVMRVAK